MTSVVNSDVLLAVAANLIPQAIAIAAYAARYAGVTTRRIATAISLFSLLVTASRLAALFMTPSLGALADDAANSAIEAGHHAVSPEQLHVYDLQMRIIVASGSVGILIGAAMLPMFLATFTRGIASFERRGSIPHALVRLLDPKVMLWVLGHLRPRRFSLKDFPISRLPRTLLVANVVLFAVYSVGVVAAFYASVIDLGARTTASGLSGIVNGIGTVAFALFIDPNTALIVDQTVRDERPRQDVAAMIFWLIVTAFIGTLLAQLILVPAAHLIAAVAHIWPHGK
ncbi:MAG TPA: DUF2837 family protein [Candidatus Elarobacter sp.]|nr:DUF2837 family protein [Candidatus Elarobacter sp.]